jgi:hypothetical protein
MTFENKFIWVPFFLCILLQLNSFGRDSTNANDRTTFVSNLKGINDLTAISPSYHTEALHMIVVEANRVAKELNLPEELPIMETNLEGSYINPPRMAQRIGAIGNLTTSNYVYYVSVGYKFSFLTRTGLESEYAELRKQYFWPMSRMDTNAAYQLAVQWLSQCSMDVAALNRDCHVHILANTPEGENGVHFIPIYWVYWVKPDQEGHGSVASVELLEPTKSLRQLRVEVSKYILRKPLQPTNTFSNP